MNNDERKQRNEELRRMVDLARETVTAHEIVMAYQYGIPEDEPGPATEKGDES